MLMTLAMDFAITFTMTVLMTGIDAGFPFEICRRISDRVHRGPSNKYFGDSCRQKNCE